MSQDIKKEWIDKIKVEMTQMKEEIEKITKESGSPKLDVEEVPQELQKDPDMIKALKELEALSTIWAVANAQPKKEEKKETKEGPTIVQMAPRLPVFECYSSDQVSRSEIEQFLDNIEEAVKENRAETALKRLSGEGCRAFRTYMKTALGDTCPTWAKFKEVFRRYFGQTKAVRALCKQKPNEPPQRLYVRIYDMIMGHMEGTDQQNAMTSQSVRNLIKKNFYAALDPRVRAQLGPLEENVSTTTIVDAATEYWEAIQPVISGATEAIAREPQISYGERSEFEKMMETMREMTKNMQAQTAIPNNNNGYQSNSQPQRNFQNPGAMTQQRPRNEMTCYYCFKPGHMARECQAWKNSNSNRNNSYQQSYRGQRGQNSRAGQGQYRQQYRSRPAFANQNQGLARPGIGQVYANRPPRNSYGRDRDDRINGLTKKIAELEEQVVQATTDESVKE